MSITSPGDYFLRASDLLKPAGLKWIGNCNGLNAGYAADGYARIKGILALSQHMGTVSSPCPSSSIVGTAARKANGDKAMVHHSVCDGDMRVYTDIYKRFTVAQAGLFDPSMALGLLDRGVWRNVLRKAGVFISKYLLIWLESKYLSLHYTQFESVVVDSMALQHYMGITCEASEFARITGFLTFGLTFRGGIINGTLPTITGLMLAITDRSTVLHTDTNTHGWSTVPRKDIAIAFRRKSIELQNQYLPIIRNLAKSLPPIDPLAPMNQDTFYLRLSSFFRPRDIIACANDTPLMGSRDFVLPPKTRLINSGIWLSIGHMLPATQGISLAKRELQTGSCTIFFQGDGSFQATTQELSTLIRHKLDARLIQGLDAEYNDVVPWQYLKAPERMGAPDDGSYDIETHDVGTFQLRKGLKLVNIRLVREGMATNLKLALKLVGQQLMADPTPEPQPPLSSSTPSISYPPTSLPSRIRLKLDMKYRPFRLDVYRSPGSLSVIVLGIINTLNYMILASVCSQTNNTLELYSSTHLTKYRSASPPPIDLREEYENGFPKTPER
ncbi:thiamine diphosphate-binding protein [Lindgomyces ingoldianus]|uniref:Thiamine diphosphate-binding protein n=1 Tax=Lindgomyces ingoldianus TaxID=673940 RepID=A0ACB6R4R5_9PLEO|nr:thiamine diphosphate-binding protein [Lindgomyces ingoldianus]KAF2474254.1 thiamine diphosphate-binding protein [Lindgomyces ingoldianus]